MAVGSTFATTTERGVELIALKLKSPGKLATAVYVLAEAVTNEHEYAVVGNTNPLVSIDEEIVTHGTAAPDPSETVHDMVPAGCGLLDDVAATKAVRVVVPPSVGELEAEIVIVGARVGMLILAEFESPAK